MVPVYGTISPTMTLNSHRPPGSGLSVRHSDKSRGPGDADMDQNLVKLALAGLVEFATRPASREVMRIERIGRITADRSEIGTTSLAMT